MPLRKRLKSVAADGQVAKGDEKKSKRERLVAFFKSRKQRKAADSDKEAAAAPIPVAVKKDGPAKPPRDSKIAESTRPAKSSSSIDVQRAEAEAEDVPLPTPSAEPTEPAEPERKEQQTVEKLSEEHVHALFSGAPNFFVHKTEKRAVPRVSFPWDAELHIKDVSDSVQLAEPAYSAATLHRHLPSLQQSSDQDKPYQGYDLDVVEAPSMLSAQGLESGTIGFAHFLELPQSDHLVTDLQQSQTSNAYLEGMRNKQLLQQNPERLGVRAVDMAMVHDRLIELGDLVEAFHDSPERMTILNNQAPGDLYANLFGKFLTPPGYDSTADDPTGMKVQIDTLLKILRLRGVWFDFSLVEWRIRLGQILWGEAEAEVVSDTQPLWTDRDILLLQITLACELLLRLDAISSMEVDDVKRQLHVSPQDFQGFLKLKTRKTDWDLVLARRFLENILVVKEYNTSPSVPDSKLNGLFSLLGSSAPKDEVRSDLVLLPQHQARQLSGLLHFAKTIQWPGIDLIVAELAQKITVPEVLYTPEQASPPTERFLDPSTPASISVYGTPLATPRSNTVLDSYFGNLQKPPLDRNDSRALQVPLTTTLLAQADSPDHALNVGGWLSRSYLTGLILPGEGISHFLISTLLENDRLAIAALGDSANLYGGFIYANRTWWSKASIVARVMGCVEGAVECMGWVGFSELPADSADGWYAVTSTQLRPEGPSLTTTEEDPIMLRSAVIPNLDESNVKAEDLTMPRDGATPPIPSMEFSCWNLTPANAGPQESDALSTPTAETESHVASVTFASLARSMHTLSLIHDVQFVTSWPCTPPTASPAPNVPRMLKRSQTSSLSRTSSKRSIHSNRTGSNRSSQLIRRNSHGFEPLLSHPPDSPSIAPTRMYLPVSDEDPSAALSPKLEPLNAHPLHTSHKYKIVSATDVLDANFVLPFTPHVYTIPASSPQTSPREEREDVNPTGEEGAVLVLDARASKDLELLARSWCAEKGFHAVIGRVGRTCLACCIREAKALGVNTVIRI
ncbi:hypothetical protein DPSP01_011165 [Paraphaeosphaeria sporulosa]|uniref:Uncharacterized protein n=1 Tax=Paraphaeosphaeria sporulosa TaxID=1460663 RepID=A0A177CJB4_9PLEO|nr:uncharacterized protein CC84DRAFT_1143118 [Paraphaeosphaeria sporulosa]OAG06929.1 hypothetical protein CC84DRAFT_1143118 [Paraphaeosphaeria sporulosa]